MFQYVSSPGIICNNSIFENNAHAHKKHSKNLLLRNHDRIENYFTSLEQRMPLDFPYEIVKQYRFHLMVVLYANLYRSCLNLNKLNNLPDTQQQFYIVHCHMVEISYNIKQSNNTDQLVNTIFHFINILHYLRNQDVCPIMTFTM